MGLANDLAALKTVKPRNFKDWRLTADAETVELVDAAIADITIPPNSLAVTLTANDVPITRETIVKIRNDARS